MAIIKKQTKSKIVWSQSRIGSKEADLIDIKKNCSLEAKENGEEDE